MTVQELEKSVSGMRYALLTTKTGRTYAVNAGCARVVKKEECYDPNKETRIESVAPCSFNLYISMKTPFIYGNK